MPVGLETVLRCVVMHYQQLQQRLASCSQASCSYAARPAAQCSQHRCSTYASCHTSVSRRHRSRHSCRAIDDDDSTAAEQIALDTRQDTVYDKMTFASNTTPDYEDPQWVEKIGDWEDFWYSTEDEDLGFDDDELSQAEKSELSLERARKLVSQLGDMRTRADVEQMITGQVRPGPFYEDTYRSEPERVMDQTFYQPDPNPDYNQIDLRALSEKRAGRAALDAQWRQAQSLLAKPFSYTLVQQLGQDARLAGSEFDWIREEWTHEQIMDLIVGGGKFVHPDKVKCRILNPLLPMDFHNDIGVHVVPETEEFIEQIGHMATEDEIAFLQSESGIQLHAKDFVDPTVVFDDQYGTRYVEAPANPWAEIQRAADAEDLVAFNSLVDKIAERTQQGERAAAAAAEGLEYAADEGEDEETLGTDDDYMGSGFSRFLAADEDNQAGLLMYEDELDGEWEESDFVDRDEAEEGEGEQQAGQGDSSAAGAGDSNQ